MVKLSTLNELNAKYETVYPLEITNYQEALSFWETFELLFKIGLIDPIDYEIGLNVFTK